MSSKKPEVRNFSNYKFKSTQEIARLKQEKVIVGNVFDLC